MPILWKTWDILEDICQTRQFDKPNVPTKLKKQNNKLPDDKPAFKKTAGDASNIWKTVMANKCVAKIMQGCEPKKQKININVTANDVECMHAELTIMQNKEDYLQEYCWG